MGVVFYSIVLFMLDFGFICTQLGPDLLWGSGKYILINNTIELEWSLA